jgi:NitT/TauT family transport system permease protein
LALGPLPALGLGAVVLAFWYALTASGGVPAYFLPAPGSVAQTFLRGIGCDTTLDCSRIVGLAPGSSAWLPTLQFPLLTGSALVTLQESLAGFALGTLVALPLAYAIAHSPLLARAVQPYLAASQAMPAVALAPLLVLWLGFGLVPVAALCALIVFFPMVVNTALGLRTLDRDVLDAARADGAGRWALLRSMELPLALPSILAGMRTSLTLSITGAVVGEFVLGGQGLGGIIQQAPHEADTALIFATLLMLGLLAAALYGAARLAERRFSYVEANERL